MLMISLPSILDSYYPHSENSFSQHYDDFESNFISMSGVLSWQDISN